MNSNRMLTMALYLLLGGLVAVFGYRACQLKKEQTAKLAEQAEMEQTLRDMGYESDQAERSGVAKPSDLTDTKATTPAAPTASTTTTTTTTTTPAATAPTTVAAPKTAEPKAVETAPKPVTSSTETKAQPTKKLVDRNDESVAATDKPVLKTTKAPAKALTSKGAAAKAAGPAKPAYAVVAASFSKKENARKVMESLVKKGFTNAEVSAKGKYWAVISDRAATKEAAAKMVELVNKQPDCAKAYVYKKP